MRRKTRTRRTVYWKQHISYICILCNLPGRYVHFIERVFLLSPPPPHTHTHTHTRCFLASIPNTEEQETIPVAAIVFIVFCACRCLCHGPILRPKESNRVCVSLCVIRCNNNSLRLQWCRRGWDWTERIGRGPKWVETRHTPDHSEASTEVCSSRYQWYYHRVLTHWNKRPICIFFINSF
jgi:hypothetical protein